MATFIVTHSLFPSNPKKFTVSVDKIVKLVGEENTIFPKPRDDDLFWEIHITVADAVDIAGNAIKSVWKDVTTLIDVDKLVVEGVNELAAQIDWSDNGEFIEQEDIGPPVVTSTVPADNQENVDIDSTIQITLEDFLPAKGIDLSSVKLFLDNTQVTPTKIEGNPFKLKVFYKPLIVREERNA